MLAIQIFYCTVLHILPNFVNNIATTWFEDVHFLMSKWNETQTLNHGSIVNLNDSGVGIMPQYCKISTKCVEISAREAFKTHFLKT